MTRPITVGRLVDPQDRYLTLADLSRYSTLSARTIRRYLDDPTNPIPSHKIGGRRVVLKSEFDQWVRDQEGKPAKNDALEARVLKALEASRRG